MDYVDLYLIHSPLRGKKLRLDSWKALEELKRSGKAKNIGKCSDTRSPHRDANQKCPLGVSNFGVHHLQQLLDHCEIKPAVNQIE
jgi:diketogulonate reductase-like aldo/keto reductase